jgi:hypothetical protein
LRTRPGKGREKAPPRSRPPSTTEQLPTIKTTADFDKVLRGLLSVPATVKPARPAKKKPRRVGAKRKPRASP